MALKKACISHWGDMILTQKNRNHEKEIQDLEHCAPPREISTHPFGLLKRPDDMALSTGLGPQKTCIILELIIGLS